jgi:murein DD-endopeptidase MepM/ murein hydrolase activator NlpD
VATSPTPKTVTSSLSASATSNPRATSNRRVNAGATSSTKTSAAASDDPRSQAIRDNALSLVRDDATTMAARSAQRENLAARALAASRTERAHGWQGPMKTLVRTSGFGWRWGRLHAGEDFAAPIGTNLVSMSTGKVFFAGQESGYGNIVKIRYWDGTVTFYGHMSRISVSEGEDLEPGEVVGESGNTGHSTGPHLHLEVHPDGGAAINPVPWLADHQIAD